MRNLYKRIGVSPDATDLEINRALSAVKHDQAHRDAKTVLLDPTKRKAYDRVHAVVSDIGKLRARVGLTQGKYWRGIVAEDFSVPAGKPRSLRSEYIEKIKTQLKADKRRRFSYHIRTLIGQTVILAVGLGALTLFLPFLDDINKDGSITNILKRPTPTTYAPKKSYSPPTRIKHSSLWDEIFGDIPDTPEPVQAPTAPELSAPVDAAPSLPTLEEIFAKAPAPAPVAAPPSWDEIFAEAPEPEVAAPPSWNEIFAEPTSLLSLEENVEEEDDIFPSKNQLYSIVSIQGLLKKLGYNPGPIDGKIGPRTKKAIRSFQYDIGLEVDGKPSASIEEWLKSMVASTTPKVARESNVETKKAVPYNGKVWSNTRGARIAPFEIKTSEGSNYFLKLSDAYTKDDVLSVFVQGGRTVTMEVPIGAYTVKYAAGSDWYGLKNLFGPKTVYSKADKAFRFEKRGNEISGYTITLYRVSGGNLHTSSINPEEF